jgi:hypothetical protein
MNIALPDLYGWQHKQVAVAFTVARQDTDIVTVRGKARRQMVAEKAAAAEDTDVVMCHDISPFCTALTM